MGQRVLQLLGARPPVARRHVPFLTDELEIAGWHVEVGGPRGILGDGGHLDHVVDQATAGTSLAQRHVRLLAAHVDVVHAHGRGAGELASSAKLGAPVVCTWYADEFDTSARSDRRLSRRVSAVVAATPAIATRADARAEVHVIRPAVGPPRPTRSRAEVRSELGVDGSRPVVLACGPLVANAGLDTVLDASIFLQQEAPALRIAITGEGPLERELRVRVNELGLSATVSVTVPTASTADLLAAVDLVIMARRDTADESLVLDAMALGRPVVAVVGALPEGLVVHGETGFLVAPGHGRLLASAIADLLAHPSLMTSLAEAAQRAVERLNDAGTLVSAVASVYRRVGA